MTNAELIAELRGHILSVPLTLLHDAADALEAADKRIAELMPKEGEWMHVVRCLECKYMRESVDGLFKSGYFCERCHITSDMENCDDFYCADGERRTDEQ